MPSLGGDGRLYESFGVDEDWGVELAESGEGFLEREGMLGV